MGQQGNWTAGLGAGWKAPVIQKVGGCGDRVPETDFLAVQQCIAVPASSVSFFFFFPGNAKTDDVLDIHSIAIRVLHFSPFIYL